ncbi:hypothetical protein UMZ34_22205 [Halopseudomonas pachastrellae]|nr:hypothetical protein UMZ34_22205 [Halopseudomonas pachastrellae]
MTVSPSFLPSHADTEAVMSTTPGKLGFNATWAMAVGGMIGGGIFSTLGVVVGIAGSLAWLSFVAAGLIALAPGTATSNWLPITIAVAALLPSCWQ